MVESASPAEDQFNCTISGGQTIVEPASPVEDRSACTVSGIRDVTGQLWITERRKPLLIVIAVCWYGVVRRGWAEVGRLF
jgi:hypothetical protein